MEIYKFNLNIYCPQKGKETQYMFHVFLLNVCTGSGVTCPSSAPEPNGTACANGQVCYLGVSNFCVFHLIAAALLTAKLSIQ